MYFAVHWTYTEATLYSKVNRILTYSGIVIHVDSGVGAGIDSYYEYCLKAYVLLGDQTYLQRFSKVSGLYGTSYCNCVRVYRVLYCMFAFAYVRV